MSDIIGARVLLNYVNIMCRLWILWDAYLLGAWLIEYMYSVTVQFNVILLLGRRKNKPIRPGLWMLSLHELLDKTSTLIYLCRSMSSSKMKLFYTSCVTYIGYWPRFSFSWSMLESNASMRGWFKLYVDYLYLQLEVVNFRQCRLVAGYVCNVPWQIA